MCTKSRNALRMMARASHEVARKVILMGRVKSAILAPYQIREVEDPLEAPKDAAGPVYSTVLSSAVYANKVRAIITKSMGENWLQN